MKDIIITIIILTLSSCGNSNEKQKSKSSVFIDINNNETILAYSLGVNVASGLKTQGVEAIDTKAFSKALNDVFQGNDLEISEQESLQIIQTYFRGGGLKRESQAAKKSKISFEESKEFIVQNFSNTNQKLIKSFVSNIGKDDIYVFFSLSYDNPGYACISMMTPFKLEILTNDCDLIEVKVDQWNVMPGSPMIYDL